MAETCRSPAFLREQINSILKFYAPVVRDPLGGFHNQLLDDGTVYDPSTKHVVGTCRFIVNYALAARVAEDDAEVDHHLEFCTHGVNFLINEHVRANASFWLGAPKLPTTLVPPRALARAEGEHSKRFVFVFLFHNPN